MKIMKTLTTTLFPLALLAIGLTNGQAQTTATWIGPSSGGEWNTATSWDLGAPPLDSTTNAYIGVGTNVSYNLPMGAASFGTMTLDGILNVNTSGFNCSAITMMRPSGSYKLYINSGATVAVSGTLSMGTNATTVMSAGSTLTASSLYVDYGTSTKAGANLSSFTNLGGILTLNNTRINSGTGTGSGLMVINGGTNNLGNTSVGRNNAGSFSTLGTEGLVIYGGLVTTSNLNVGNWTGNSYLSMYVAGGVVTNYGNMIINQGTATRASRFVQSGGLFVVPDPGIVNPDSTNSSSCIYAVLGGTNIVGGFSFGNLANTSTSTNNFTNSAVVYVGSQGIVSNGSVIVNVSLNNGGLFGATADWTSSAPMFLNGATTIFTFQTADMDGTSHNITLTGGVSGSGSLKKTGAGTLALNATNTYTGSTILNAGSVVLGATAAVASSPIIVGSGTTLDASAIAGGFTVNAAQTLAGSGTVIGVVTVASSGIVNPGSNTLAGTLTFANDLIETNGAVNHFDLSGIPSSSDNDSLVVTGTLNVSAGTNTIEIGGAPENGGVYKLFQYGALSGGITNFITSGGTLSNSTAGKAIYLVAFSTNHPPTNVVWLGNATANNWDMITSTNWSINGTGPATNSVAGDSEFFTDMGGINPIVSIPGAVTPGSVTVNSSSNYTFTGTGSIAGTAGLTKTNSGTLIIGTTNTYTGVTTIGGGVLVVSNLANGLSASSIGAPNVDPSYLVIKNGTLSYAGTNVSIDRGVTFPTNSYGVVQIPNTNVTLTLNGTLAGDGTFVKSGPGNVILTGANTHGSTVVSNGTLQINSQITALGSGTLAFAGGTVNLNVSLSPATYSNPINVMTTGTLISGSSKNNNILSGPWSGSGTLTVSMGNNTTGAFSIGGNMTTNFTGTIRVTDDSVGSFRFYGSSGSSMATFDMGNSTNAFLCSKGGGTFNLGALVGGKATTLRGSAGSVGTDTFVIGGNNLSTAFSGMIEDGIGTGTTPTTTCAVSLVKTGTGTLTLDGGMAYVTSTSDGFTWVTNLVASSTNMTYSGSTIISNGVLRLVVPVTLTNAANTANTSTPITLASATAVLDGTAMGYSDVQYDSDGVTVTNIILFTNGVFELAPNQSLTGIGTILASNVLADAASLINPGLPLGVLTASQNIELAGAVNMNVSATSSPNCSEIVSPNITIDGTATLTVTNLGPEAGATFKLFSRAVSGFASVTLPTLTGTNSWVNNLAVDGSITLLAEPLVMVNTNAPYMTNTFDSGSGTLTLSWPANGYIGSWHLQSQTNTSSAGLTTNWVDMAGSSATNKVVVTVDKTKGTVFFRLVYP
jgi:autotransporter-associated beta strand protein